VAGANSPTVRRRELGTLLRSLRADAGLTVDSVAERLLCSPSKVSRLETGQRGASLRDVRDLCDLYEVSPAMRERLMTLAREGKQQAWWHSYDLRYETYVGLEDEAASIRLYNANVVPSLLQTPEYARAVLTAVLPESAPGLVDKDVEARLTRQQLLRKDNPPYIQAVLDESVLRRVVGDPMVMQTQLQQLLDLSRLPNIAVHVIPYEAGALPAVETKFNILGFTTPALSDVVFVEGLVGDLYIERAADVREYHRVFDLLLKAALSTKHTNGLITKMQSLSNESAESRS